MVGSTLSHYRIVSELGRGGMGIVFQAQDTKLNRTVAIKVLPAAALSNEDDRARFYREARAAASLSHPHIAVVHEIDEAIPSDAPHGTDPRPFIAMEYIEGETLDARIKRGPLKLEEAVRIASEIASALEAAHEKQIVHRDIKSANVMLTAKGEAKVLDFGLAQTAQSTKLTRMGSTVGTIGYMSPEQARGEEVDLRTDIWALGVILYEMISGRHPFPGEYEQAVVYEILNKDPEPLTSLRTGVPMALEWIVGKMLAKAAKARYQSTAEILVDLAAVDLKSASGFSRVSTAAVASGARSGRSRTLSMPMVAAMLFAVAVVSALAASLLRPSGAPEAAFYANINVEQRGFGLPALSPDGRYLAYSGGERGGYWALFIRDNQTGKVISVPQSDGARPGTFSPDGSRLAFVSLRNLFTVSVTGGEPQPWTAGASMIPVWGTEGEIYFKHGPDIMRIDGPRESPALFLAPDTTVGQRSLYPAQMLHDAGQFLVIDETVGADRLLSVDMDTRNIEVVMERDAFTVLYAPSGHLLYVTKEFEPIWARPFDPRTLQFTGPASVVHPVVYAENWAISESGNFVAVQESATRNRHLFVLDAAGETRPLPAGVREFNSVRAGGPDLRYLALQISSVLEEESQIVIWDTETSTPRTLIPADGKWNNDPAWSPDGTRIVFSSNRDSLYAHGLFVQNADGSGSPTSIWQTRYTSRLPDWSPDTDHIVFESRGDLWLYSFSEGNALPLGREINAAGSQTRARFSPDGRFIAYESSETGQAKIYVAKLDGSFKMEVTPEMGFFPLWSRDGSRLYYYNDSAIYGVNVEFEPVFRALGEPEVVYDSELLYTLDSLGETDTFVISELTEITRDYFEVILNWFEEVERLAPHAN